MENEWVWLSASKIIYVKRQRPVVCWLLSSHIICTALEIDAAVIYTWWMKNRQMKVEVQDYMESQVLSSIIRS